MRGLKNTEEVLKTGEGEGDGIYHCGFGESTGIHLYFFSFINFLARVFFKHVGKMELCPVSWVLTFCFGKWKSHLKHDSTPALLLIRWENSHTRMRLDTLHSSLYPNLNSSAT